MVITAVKLTKLTTIHKNLLGRASQKVTIFKSYVECKNQF